MQNKQKDGRNLVKITKMENLLVKELKTLDLGSVTC